MAKLFEPLKLRGLVIRNRAWLSPMCQYSCEARDGVPTDWHLVHLGARAAGGFGLVIAEATAVVPEGRISAEDTGLWNDAQAAAWRRIADFVHSQGSAFGIQLAHAGRKAGTTRGWPGESYGPLPLESGGWQPVGPSPAPFVGLREPHELTVPEIQQVTRSFAEAARRADAAGFDVVEIHAAHGYLLHEFYSPLSNHRTDAYGGSFEGRTRLLLEVTEAVRAVWPESKPLFVRISATDWTEDGWSIDDSVALAQLLRDRGVDLIDASTGGNAVAQIPVGPGYQVGFAERLRHEAHIATGAVGLITDPRQAEEILESGAADAVLLARVALREPSWPMRAAHDLAGELDYPPQYHRGHWEG